MTMVLRSLSSSSSSSYSMSNSHLSSFCYDVFISFRGKDTRRTFTDHLYKALKQDRIRTFRDDDAMDRGRLLKPELEKAIQQSQVSLIIFSKSYATSKWCLDEVLMIMEEYDQTSSTNKHREVVPVFYNIDPTDVRNQTGCFEEAFKCYDDEVTRETNVEKKMELKDKVEAWRSSLRKAGSLTGMVPTEYGYETEFISNIVNVIRKKVSYNALYIKDKLVGMKEDVARIESWLQDPSPDSTILLIDGMGGIGKTTIAKCVYNMNCREYDGCCFLANINETPNQSNGMLRLQSQLLSTILKSEKEETIWNQDEGTIKVAKAICNKKVLLVLDDVATSQQLDALLGQQMFYPGSKVIITSRHTWLSTAFKVRPMVQTIRTLSKDDSVELFSLYAFPQNQPIEPYFRQSEQVSQVIHHCEGLPLALEVLGSNLRGKSIAQWKDAMSKLEKYPHPGIQKVLQLSYESLEDENDKDLFLHIACFFVGEDEDVIIKVLGECKLYPIIGIKNLTDRNLLYIANGKVGMHQLISDMGKEVVRQESPKDPGKRSRLWDHEDCFNVLQENAGTEKVEGLMFDLQNMKEAKKLDNSRKHGFLASNFKIGALEKMKNLMLLQLNYLRFSGKFNKLFGKYKKFPRELRLLRWHGFSLKSIPGDIPLEKLVVLDMSYSKLKRVWDGYKCIESLKILNLSYSVELIKTPDFGGLHGLESLILKGCTSLTKIDRSIASLEKLVVLDATNCRSLRNLPNFGGLRGLESLILKGCTSLTNIDRSIASLEKLVVLDATDCISLRNVPLLPTSLASLQMSDCPTLGTVGGFRFLESISSLSLLVKLNISYCNLFDNSFPNDWSNLVSLKKLRINGNNVTFLPKCIQNLPRIERLEARECSHIKSVLGPPKTLTHLDIKYNKSLVKVQVPPKKYVTVLSLGCQNLSCIEGHFKWQPIEKVERKIIQNLGLGSSNAYGGIDFKPKVVFEYGIFSTCVTEEQIPPSSFFMYKERGPQISFVVPSHHHQHRIISGFAMCLVFSPIHDKLWIELYNKTKNLEWRYMIGTLSNNVKEGEKGGWLSVWRCDNLLHAGDEIFVRILYNYVDGLGVCTEVEECCMNLIYDDEEDVRKRKEMNANVVISEYNDDDEIIRWNDKVEKDISDYVHSGMEYRFGNYVNRDYDRGFIKGELWNISGEERKGNGLPTNGVQSLISKKPLSEKPLTLEDLSPEELVFFAQLIQNLEAF